MDWAGQRGLEVRGGSESWDTLVARSSSGDVVGTVMFEGLQFAVSLAACLRMGRERG